MFYHSQTIVNAETEPSTMWRTSGRATGEDLVSAHISGIEIGMQQHEKIIQEQHLNLKKIAFKISEDVYSRLKENFKIKPLGMRLRTQGFSAFGTLFMLTPDVFYSDMIEDIYKFLNEERKKITPISWSFVVMPAAKSLNESAITSDGYISSYAESA